MITNNQPKGDLSNRQRNQAAKRILPSDCDIGNHVPRHTNNTAHPAPLHHTKWRHNPRAGNNNQPTVLHSHRSENTLRYTIRKSRKMAHHSNSRHRPNNKPAALLHRIKPNMVLPNKNLPRSCDGSFRAYGSRNYTRPSSFR